MKPANCGYQWYNGFTGYVMCRKDGRCCRIPCPYNLRKKKK